MSIRILTDSTSDIPQEIRAALGVEMLPLKVRFGDEEFADDVTITKTEFYSRLRAAKDLPVTSQVNPSEFAAFFEEAGEEDVVVVTLASKLSGTYQSAEMAKEQTGRQNVYIVDSCTATIGCALLVREAVRLREEGKTGAEIFQALQSLKARMNMLITVDTLTYLVKGGRLSAVAGAMGGLLGIKPVIQVDKTGTIGVLNKARGFRNACAWMIEEAKRRGVDSNYPIGLAHADNPTVCAGFEAGVLDLFPGCNTFVQELGAVIGTHTGPDALAMAFIEPEQK